MKVLITGSNGLVGSSVNRILEYSKKVTELLPTNRGNLDLFDYHAVLNFIEKNSPEIIVNCAAKVGGIYANNTQRTEFILNNLKINMNLLEASINFPNIRIINLGSSCIYPLNAENPIKESYVMTGPLEPTNSPYAMAKLTSIEIGRSISSQYGHKIINLMPTNLYGPKDNFSSEDSHVIPGLIARMHKEKINNSSTFKIWGTGKPLREFMYVDDLALAIEFLLDKDIEKDLINVGTGSEIQIAELAEKLKNVVGFEGELIFDSSKPDGNPRKLISSDYLKSLGWKPKTDLDSGLEKTYNWYLNNL
jgi:GDP-L-fucose synthase